MIELTVKTLDSQNHAFALEDDQITVRTFKEHIAESVAVPADSQRLIYCGRVLQDEKKLNDYDVNGKVIHLVQRAPPQPGQHANENSQNQGQNHGQGWQNTQRTHFRLAPAHVRAIHLGAMSASADIMERHGIPMPQLSQNLANSRLAVAKGMLRRASELISRLDDPNCPLNPPASENNQTPSAEQAQAQQGETEHNDINESRTSNGTASVIAAALSAAGANNITIVGVSSRTGSSDGGAEARPASGSSDGNQPGSQEQQESQTPNQGSTANNDGQSNRRTDPQVVRPPQMAELFRQLSDIQTRFRPYLERYYTILEEDPVLTSGPGPDSLEATQRIVDVVSKICHCLSHACHALCDIILDLRQPPPRTLQCRPVIIQESAILESDAPIQVQARINLRGSNVNNNNGNEEANESANAQSQSAQANAENSGQQRDTENAGQQQAEQQEQAQSPFGAVFNLPSNVEVLMEVTPESNIEVPVGSEQAQTGENNNNNNNAGRMNGTGDVPRRSRPRHEVIRNFMQFMAGHIVENALTATTIMTRNASASVGQQQQPVATSPDTGTTNAGQSTQARSNSGTHPTTATQTRSTSRPHVFHQQPHPFDIGMRISSAFDFDPFLPCNSHHFRQSSTTIPNTVPSMSQGARPNRTSTTEAQTQAQSTTTTRNTSTTASNANASNTTSTNTTPPTTPPNTGTNPLVGLFQQILRGTTGQPQASISISGPELAASLGNVVEMFSGGNIHVGIVGDRTYAMNAADFTLADMVEGRGVSMDLFGPGNEGNFLDNLSVLVAENVTVEGLMRLRLGEWEPVANLRRPLQDFAQYSCPNTTVENRHEQASDLLLAQLRPHLQNVLAGEEEANSTNPRVDICATIESLIRQHMKDVMRVLYDNALSDARFAQETINIMQHLGRQLCIVLRYYCRGGQTGFEALVSRFATEMLTGVEPDVRELLMNEYIVYFRTHSLRLPQPPESEIIPLLVYKQAPPEPPVAPPTPAPQPTQQTPSEFEPMETEPAEERPSTEAPVPEETEEIPETFPGRGVLPPEWISIIAGDGVRQRRQLQMQGMAIDGVTPFSDAYLGTMPSKRRKLIEKHKPRLLVSPTPNNSAITASMERLVREGVEQAGVEEVEGAAVAVAADPAVRRAFGQAIRDCLNPCRYGTPDFPDPLRFPNATKYFADPERSSKQ